MSGKKSLYDLLEVSTTASAEAIRASFDRLTAKFDSGLLQSPTGLDADSYYNLIKDAYFTLGNPNTRQAYDQRLMSVGGAAMSSVTYYDDRPTLSLGAKLFIGALIAAVAVYAFKIHRDSQIETARLLAETQEAALQKEALAYERQSQTLSAQQSSIERDETRRMRMEAERARAEAEQNSNRLQRTDEQYRREDERKRNDEERRRQGEMRESQNRAEQERNRAIRTSQQQDYGRPKGAAIENKPDTLTPTRRY